LSSKCIDFSAIEVQADLKIDASYSGKVPDSFQGLSVSTTFSTGSTLIRWQIERCEKCANGGETVTLQVILLERHYRPDSTPGRQNL
jgi:hypothetical protein